MAYTNLSAAYHILDQNEKAIEYCEKGLNIFRLKGIRQSEGRSCLNLSSYYLHRGDYATALKYNEEALKTIRSLGYKAEEGDMKGLSSVTRKLLVSKQLWQTSQSNISATKPLAKPTTTSVSIEKQFTMRIEVSKWAKNWNSDMELP